MRDITVWDQQTFLTIGECRTVASGKPSANLTARRVSDYSLRAPELQIPAATSVEVQPPTSVPIKPETLKPLLYSYEDLRRLGIKLSHSTLQRLEKAGRFPRRLYLGAHSLVWVASEVLAHITALADKRGQL
jgi:prophage regulatory protein